jgi:hypothetical protein
MNQYSWRTKWLAAFAVAAVLIYTGYTVNHFFFKSDPLVEEQLLWQFGDNFFYNFDLDPVQPAGEPEDDVSGEPGVQEAVENPPPESSSDSGPETETTAPPKNDDPKETTPPPTAPAVTLESIVARYEPKFYTLEAIATERLEQLYQAALEEYRQKKSDGTLNTIELASKYSTAGRMLEKSVDAQFYALLDELREELIANSFPTDIIHDIEQHYKTAKTGRKRELLSRLGN